MARRGWGLLAAAAVEPSADAVRLHDIPRYFALPAQLNRTRRHASKTYACGTSATRPLRRSLHVIGERDTIVAPCRSEELLAAFVGPSVHRHDLVGEPAALGGHVVPWDEPFYASVAALLAGTVTMM